MPVTRKQHAGITLIALLLGIVSLTGCSSTTATQTLADDAAAPPPSPVVIAGDQPDEAAAAFDAARQELSQAQWDILERYAPRSVWQRIRENRATIEEAKNKVVASTPAVPAPADAPPPVIDPADVPVTELPDTGRVRMYYRIRHYGGASVKSNVSTGLARRAVEVKPDERHTLEKLVANHLGDRGTAAMLPDDQVLVINCDKDAQAGVLELLARVDQPTPQVEITARIFEVQHDMDFQSGVKILLNYLGSNDAGGLASVFSAEDFANSVVNPITGNVPDPSAAMRLVNVFGDSGFSMDTTIEAMSKTGLIKLVSSPRMTVTVGNTGYVLAGQELPVQSAVISNNNVVSQQIAYKPVGVQLYVTPQVIGDDSVKLHVVTVASEITGFQSLAGIGGATTPTVNPVFDTREAESYVTVSDQDTLVIGGLRRMRAITRENKIPGFGDLPYLGWLFKNHRSQTQITDLYFFITPRIIRP